MTCSDLSSVAPQHEDRFEGQSLEITTASDHLSQHLCLSPGYKIVMDNIDKKSEASGDAIRFSDRIFTLHAPVQR